MVDPLDEFHSPYTYVGNNPINLVDPDGMETVHYDANWTQVGLSEVVWWQPWTWKHMGSNYTYNGGPIQELCTVEAFSENYYASQIIVDNVNKISYKVPANKSDHIDQPLLSPLDFIGGGSSAGFRILSKGAAKGVLKPLGLGSTAKPGVSRVNPINLTEELALKEIMSNPSMGRVMDGLKKGMTDKRWHKDNGWVKMSWNNGGVEIHYVGQWQNGVLKAVDDFKIIGQ